MDSTSTAMITEMISSTQSFFSITGIPILYLFLIIFFTLFGMGILWWAFVKGVKRAGRAVGVK